jgi:hypothetical protein
VSTLYFGEVAKWSRGSGADGAGMFWDEIRSRSMTPSPFAFPSLQAQSQSRPGSTAPDTRPALTHKNHPGSSSQAEPGYNPLLKKGQKQGDIHGGGGGYERSASIASLTALTGKT